MFIFFVLFLHQFNILGIVLDLKKNRDGSTDRFPIPCIQFLLLLSYIGMTH